MIRSSQFKAAWWLPGKHLQTLWPAFSRKRLRIHSQRETIRLPDGDPVELDWVGSGTGPIVILLHGLAGSVNSSYMKGALKSIAQQSWRGVVINFKAHRHAGRLVRTLHTSDTRDLAFVVRLIQERFPSALLAAVGYSLGGNLLLRWLGETGTANPLKACVAISVPFDIEYATDQMRQGMSRLYQWFLLGQLRQALRQKALGQVDMINRERLHYSRTFFEFDSNFSAPAHGFSDVHAYYRTLSCRPYLKQIQVRSLILHALDDPLLSKAAIPKRHELSEQIIFELSQKGGHLGFISGQFPWAPKYWVEQRMIEFLQDQIAPTQCINPKTKPKIMNFTT